MDKKHPFGCFPYALDLFFHQTLLISISSRFYSDHNKKDTSLKFLLEKCPRSTKLLACTNTIIFLIVCFKPLKMANLSYSCRAVLSKSQQIAINTKLIYLMISLQDCAHIPF